MLSKRNDFMTTPTRSVKELGSTLALMAGFGMLTLAPAASAGNLPMVDRVVKVKISMAELQAENGVQSVYQKLEKVANRTCRRDTATLAYLQQSKGECADDLLSQFVENSKLESLQNYHLSLTAVADSEIIAPRVQ